MDIRFPDDVVKLSERQTFRFIAEVGERPLVCNISRDALEQRFGASWDDDAVDAFLAHRRTIENTAGRLIREGRFETDRSILIRPEDLS